MLLDNRPIMVTVPDCDAAVTLAILGGLGVDSMRCDQGPFRPGPRSEDGQCYMSRTVFTEQQRRSNICITAYASPASPPSRPAGTSRRAAVHRAVHRDGQPRGAPTPAPREIPTPRVTAMRCRRRCVNTTIAAAAAARLLLPRRCCWCCHCWWWQSCSTRRTAAAAARRSPRRRRLPASADLPAASCGAPTSRTPPPPWPPRVGRARRLLPRPRHRRRRPFRCWPSSSHSAAAASAG